MKSIQELIEQADLAHAEETQDNQNRTVELKFLTFNLPAWKRWYLKKNQTQNYFRVTRIVPPGLEEHPGLWRQQFQVWTKGELSQVYDINAETFDYFYSLPGWEQHQTREMEYATLKPTSVHPQNATL